MKKMYQITAALVLLGMLAGCDTEDIVKSQAETAAAKKSTQASMITAEDEKIYEQEITEAQQQDGAASQEADVGYGEGDDRSGGGDVIKAAEKSGWYMRTIVTATLPDGKSYRHDTAGVFGELDESDDRRDRHDVESFGKAVLQTVFVNNSVNIYKEYFSDYRSYQGADFKQVWTFLVKNETGEDLSNAALKIEVSNVFDVFKQEGSRTFDEKISSDQSKRANLILVDVDNQKVYSYDELENATLSMDGKHVRTFRWVLNGSVSSEDMAPRKVIGTTSTASAASAFASKAVSATGSSKFGLPPE